MLEQWRAGLPVSEAVFLESRDLHLDSDPPGPVVRQGKGRKPRVVPAHPVLQRPEAPSGPELPGPSQGVPRGWECPGGGIEGDGKSTGTGVGIIGRSSGILA